MSFLFGSDTPTPQPVSVPASPLAPDNAEAERQRQEAERAAVVERASAGRRSTIVAGMEIAADEREKRGLLAAKRRAAAREIVG